MEPAIVITIPSGLILRTQWAVESTKYAFGAGTPSTILLSSTRSRGALILAFEP